MTSPRIIRRLLLITALAWGFGSIASQAAIDQTSLHTLLGELRDMAPDERELAVRSFVEEISHAPPEVRMQRRMWLKAQLAALSPEERDQLRNQIREHWQRMPPEERLQLREERRRPPQGIVPIDEQGGSQNEPRPQRLSPAERQEFRQWMRTRQNGPGD